MPVWEADPWRLQYFDGVHCPAGVNVPTEDSDAWLWNPEHRWVYDKIAVALSQGLEAAPHGVTPPGFPVFSKPIVNLRGMGAGSRLIGSAAEYGEALQPGHMWMTLLTGEHVSSDVAVVRGEPRWWRHTTGVTGPGGTFDYWAIHAEAKPALELASGEWARRHLAGYTGMLNLETIGGRIIEAHLRFADQWPDLYGGGWVEALIDLYARGEWEFSEPPRGDAYSVVLFGPTGRYRHPDAGAVAAARALPGVSSVQITFHEDRAADLHAMPPGGFRLAIVNAHTLAAGREGRLLLQSAFQRQRAEKWS